MQRLFPLSWFRVGCAAVCALYVSGIACASTEPAAAIAPPAPHIALLLPLHSQALGLAAETIRQGIMAAASQQKAALPLRIYDDFDETRSVAAYQSAVANGAVAVIGPLTRGGIRQLADEKSLAIPTLALNSVENMLPPNLYTFGMAVDGEARQIAQLASRDGLEQAIVIASNDSFSHRLQFAFEEQWIASGGTILREIEFSGDTSVFANLVATPGSMVFFATDVEKARAIRPFLPNNLAAYATSQLFIGNQDSLLNFDLEGIHFIDMPWLLQAEQPQIAAYPRANPPLSNDQERLYALGIDAYRLLLLLNKQATLEGVTGRIKLNGQVFQREALPALFVQGHGQSADAAIAPAVQLFPDQFKNTSQVEAPLPARP